MQSVSPMHLKFPLDGINPLAHFGRDTRHGEALMLCARVPFRSKRCSHGSFVLCRTGVGEWQVLSLIFGRLLILPLIDHHMFHAKIFASRRVQTVDLLNQRWIFLLPVTHTFATLASPAR